MSEALRPETACHAFVMEPASFHHPDLPFLLYFSDGIAGVLKSSAEDFRKLTGSR
jgi:hypothetical protein